MCPDVSKLITGVSLILLLPAVLHAEDAKGLRVVYKDSQGRDVECCSYAGSYALLIGVSDYTGGWPDLDAVPSEMEAVEQALSLHGFQVQKVLNPDGDGLERAFKSFIQEHGYEESNRLLFFFSGHGYTRENRQKGYLVPADAPDPRKDEKAFLRKALTMNDILNWSRKMEARHALFLFDSCFSGTVFHSKALPEAPPHIQALTAKPVRQFITAGSAGEEVPAKSVFTPCFIKALRGEADLTKDGFITGTELGLYLLEKVKIYDAAQTPQYGKIRDPELDEGDFVFAVTSSHVVTPPPPPIVVDKPLTPAEKPSPERPAASPTVRVEKSKEPEVYTKWPFDEKEAKRRQEETAKVLAWPVEYDEDLGGGMKMRMVLIPAGEFLMGSPNDEDGRGDDELQHRVRITKPFYMGKYEVTQAQWKAVTGTSPSHFKGDENPVDMVSWDDVQGLLERLNTATLRPWETSARGRFSLPTEAQWEYACRAGSDRRYSFGDGDGPLWEYAWFDGNSDSKTHPAGLKKPNAWGLHDMHGNVLEWCQDFYGSYPVVTAADPAGVKTGDGRVIRGGLWRDAARVCRASSRNWNKASDRDKLVGLRLVLNPVQRQPFEISPAADFGEVEKAHALQLQAGKPYTISGTGMTDGKDHWYKVIMPKDGNGQLQVEMIPTPNLKVGIYLYEPDDRQAVMTSIAAASGMRTSLFARLVPGNTYYLDAFGKGEGSYELSISCSR
ncbi:MAG: SUMF1/EgtB/PvdO family nonheme iron enzyme [Planctomycetes bacterium]|nr:SUMF1/EgtB/PvdO family nonheme iron enzyme [Planctomycetota bacterium]